MKCPATTHRLNCGCCEEVVLDCSLDEGHAGGHVCRDDHAHLTLVWLYDDGWGRDPHVRSGVARV